MNKLMKTVEQVHSICSDYSQCRDDDTALLWYFYQRELRKLGKVPNKISWFNFLKLIQNGLMPKFPTVLRARRKAQELYPEIRGAKWKQRHEAQAQVKSDLGYR